MTNKARTTKSPVKAAPKAATKPATRASANPARSKSQPAKETKTMNASAKINKAREKVSDAIDDAGRTTSRLVEENGRNLKKAYNTTASRTSEFAREHPFAVGAMGLVAGFALGALLPRTKAEDGTFGARRDGLLRKATETGRDVLHEGRRVAEDKIREFSGSDSAEEEALEEGLEDSFPASDPVSATSVSRT